MKLGINWGENKGVNMVQDGMGWSSVEENGAGSKTH